MVGIIRINFYVFIKIIFLYFVLDIFYYKFSIHFFLDNVTNFVSSLIIIIKKFFIFHQKRIHLVLLKSLVYRLIPGPNMGKGINYLLSL